MAEIDRLSEEIRELTNAVSAMRENVQEAKQSLVEMLAVVIEMNDTVQDALGS